MGRPFVGPVSARAHRVHGRDHRYSRPHPLYVRHHPRARYAPPRRAVYRPYYTRWWVHPYYRWRMATVAVVSFRFAVHPWTVSWSPPPRAGWLWVPGYWSGGIWVPGHWRPLRGLPAGYTYVPGWWEGDVYVEGYYRVDEREDGDWVWVEGYYLDDGTYVRGYWRPAGDAPEGYLWEPGVWDGEGYLDGFWRPEYRSGFTWVSAYYDDNGVYNSGYWYPVEEQPGFQWIPGWFDGNTWVEGYWERTDLVQEADLESWEPEAGWDAGWEAEEGWNEGEILDEADVEAPERPLAMPVEPVD